MVKLSFIMIGEQSRLIRCADVLLQKGHKIHAVISAESAVREWTKVNQLEILSPSDNLEKFLHRWEFDVLLSIDNFSKIPDELRKLASLYALNFHDGPLPRYAGVNATTWAIINGESSHGVTWHVMTDRIDAGDVVKQSLFSLDDQETSVTLNARCYEESVNTFADLVDDLEAMNVKLIPQDICQRSYYPRWKRPRLACILDLSRPGAEIDCLFRALDFGSYWNPMGLPKLFLGKSIAVPQSMEIVEGRSNVPPGTLTAISDAGIRVATGDCEVWLTDLLSLDGGSLSGVLAAEEAGVAVGETLPRLSDEGADEISSVYERLCSHEAYWANKLCNLEPLEIPYARRHLASDAVQHRDSLYQDLPGIIGGEELANDPADRVMVALLVYLWRICGEKEFDLAYRDEQLAELLSGMEFLFQPLVPIHTRVDPTDTLADVCTRMLEEISATHVRGSFAKDLILRHKDLRDSRRYHHDFYRKIALERISNSQENQSRSTAELVFVVSDDGNRLLWLYNSDVFDREDIQRMARQFETLVESLKGRWNQPVINLPILPAEDAKVLLKTWWKGGIASYKPEVCIHKLFEAQAEAKPDAIALSYQGSHLSYAEVNRSANRIAGELIAKGARPETLVAIYASRTPDLVIGILGVLKSGAAYVPLDPMYPNDRLAFILEDTQVAILLTESKRVGSLPSHSAEIVLLDDSVATPVIQNNTFDMNPAADVKPENLAYVIYTSGSTGKPKGVLVTHANVVRLFDATDKWFRFDETDVWTLFHSSAFDFSVWEIWGALTKGGRLVVVPFEISRSSTEFRNMLAAEKVTVLNQTPSAFLQLMRSDQLAPSKARLSLRFVIFGGEALNLQSLHPWVDRYGDSRPKLINMYGITETTVHVTYRPITVEDVAGDTGSVIGVPIPDLEVYILDQNRKIVPIGVPGELYVGGGGVTRGYLNRPDLTSERFVTNPFTATSGAVLYRTGDLVRFISNGDLEYLGRIDQQVQIRGFRVELGEIEAALTQHRAVTEAAVLLYDTPAEEKILAAYVVVDSKQSVTVAELRANLRQKLPEYMIPQSFALLDVLPLTGNGKIDRRALPKPVRTRQTDESYIPPSNQIEQTVASIWREVLDIEVVGSRDNFFDLGGHSLLLAKVLSRLQEVFPNKVSMTDLFRYPTVEALSAFVSQRGKVGSSPMAVDTQLIMKQKQALARQRKVATRRSSREQR